MLEKVRRALCQKNMNVKIEAYFVYIENVSCVILATGLSIFTDKNVEFDLYALVLC